jgi:WD40 repeat protein
MIRLWDMQLHGASNPTREREDFVNDLLLSPNGELVASTTYPGTMRFWDVKTGKCIQRLENVAQWIRLQLFSPDSHRLLFTDAYVDTAKGDWRIRCFHTDSGNLDLLDGHKGIVEKLEFSPDGQLLVSSSADQTIRVWKWERHELCAVYENATLHNLMKSLPEGSVITTWKKSDNGMAIDTTSVNRWKPLHWTPFFSADGQFLATTSKSGTIQVWEIKTGESHPIDELYETLNLYCPPLHRTLTVCYPSARGSSGCRSLVLKSYRFHLIIALGNGLRMAT